MRQDMNELKTLPRRGALLSTIEAPRDFEPFIFWPTHEPLRPRHDVHTNVVIVHGKPQNSDGHGIRRCLWVHPGTGILMDIPVEKRYLWRGCRTKFDKVPIDANHKYVRINGRWYFVNLTNFVEADYERFLSEASASYRTLTYDVVFLEDLHHSGSDARTQLCREWGGCVYASDKRQIGRREVKKVMAQWAALELARDVY